ncbi:DUF6890 family protein [Marinibactrum halimedae]
MEILAKYYLPHQPLDENTMAEALFLDKYLHERGANNVTQGIAHAFKK